MILADSDGLEPAYSHFYPIVSFMFALLWPALVNSCSCYLHNVRLCILQNNVIPTMLVSMISCGANAVLHYGLVYHANMGIK